MNRNKYIGMDVHQATISVAVMDKAEKVVMDSVIENKNPPPKGTALGTRGRGYFALAPLGPRTGVAPYVLN